MRAVESEGNTVEQAVGRALILLDLPRDQVDVEVIREPQTGLKTAIVRVAPKGQIRTEVSRETSAPVPAQPAPREPGEIPTSDESNEMRGLLAELIGLMGIACQVAPAVVEEDGQRIRFELSGEDTALVIGKQGQTLDAVELMMNRISERRWPGSSQITVDAEGYRGRRAQKLADLALEDAREVRRLGRSIALEPMSPRDRRSVHIALRDEPGIVTRSEGEGQFRHIIIEPARPLGPSSSRSPIR